MPPIIAIETFEWAVSFHKINLEKFSHDQGLRQRVPFSGHCKGPHFPKISTGIYFFKISTYNSLWLYVWQCETAQKTKLFFNFISSTAFLKKYVPLWSGTWGSLIGTWSPFFWIRYPYSDAFGYLPGHPWVKRWVKYPKPKVTEPEKWIVPNHLLIDFLKSFCRTFGTN